MTTRTASSVDAVEPAAQRRTELEAVFRDWLTIAKPDAREALQTHPALAAEKSAVIELAYVAFRRRRQAGEVIEPKEYCRGFPDVESSLNQILEVDGFLSHNSELAEEDEDLQWPQSEERVAGFEILEELGRGAFSRVYLARETSLGNRLVALKASLLDVGEAETLGRLNHQHIVPIHSVYADSESDLVYLCMPYYGRATLADLIHEASKCGSKSRLGKLFATVAARDGEIEAERPPGQFSIEADYSNAVLNLGVALAEALHHAHERGVLHLDLKPSNVLLAGDGRPLLLDFNLSADEHNLCKRLGGTLPYMAPEALQKLVAIDRTAAPLDRRADVFSLGVLLYQLLTLRLPYPVARIDAPLVQLAANQTTKIASGITSLRTLAPQLDARTVRVIERCLSAKPLERPSSAGEVAAELRRCLTVPARLRRTIRRRPLASSVAAACFAVILCGGGAYLVTRPPEHVRCHIIGSERLAAGSYSRAIEQFDAALRIKPDHAESLLARGEAYLRLGENALALESLIEANRLQPTPKGFTAACFAACRLNRFEEAIAAGEKGRNSYPPNPVLLNNLGFALFKAGRFAESEQILSAACELPDAPEAAYFNRAALEFQRIQGGKHIPLERAVADLRRIVAAHPASGEAYFQLAYLLACGDSRTQSRVEEIRSLLKLSVAWGAPSNLILSLRPLVPEIDDAEFRHITATHVQDRNFTFDRLVAPY